MKPRFAIRFADDGLALLHRSRRGWVEVGDTAFDTPDLDQAMAWLRSSALGLSPDGIETWLVLPNSQILYVDVAVDGSNAAAQRAAIAAALEGRTPYDVADLVYDFILNGTVAQVAVVARETLEEAEGFAVQHGLMPVGFTAVPGPGRFDAAPFFGMTSVMAKLFPGKVVRREARPVVVALAPESMPAQSSAPLADPEADPTPEHLPGSAPAAELSPASSVAVAEGPATEAPAEAPILEPTAESAVAVAFVAPEPEPEPVLSPLAVPEAVPMQAVLAFDPPTAPVSPSPVSPARAIPEVEEAPIALDVPDEYEAPRFALRAGDGLAVTSPETAADDDDVPTPVPSGIAASLSFASRRTVEASIVRGETAKFSRAVGGAMRGQPGLTAPKDAPAPTAPNAMPLSPIAKADLARAKPPVSERRTTARVTAKQSPAGAAAAAKPTEFNPKPRPPVAGKPRYLGLILTGVLLLFLAVAAALSNYLIAGLDWGDPTPEVETVSDTSVTRPATEIASEGEAGPDAAGTLTAETAEPPVAAPDAAAPDATTPDADAPEIGTAETAAPQVATAEATPPPTETQQATAAPNQAPAAPAAAAVDPISEPSATPPTVAVTDAANVATVPQAPEAIILSGTDQAPAASDAGALPNSQAQGDPPPAAVAAPPPFGTVYQFDEKGLIVPTPEGIRTPAGVLLVAGPPPLKPPPRPEGLVPETVVPETLVPQTAAAVAPVPEALPADPALAGVRPRARPADLSPPPTNSGALIPASASAIEVMTSLPVAQNTGRRPAARPQAVLDAGLQAQQEQLAAASLAASALSDPNRSILAIAVSRRPAPRPADMARAVEAAVAAAARLPAPEPQPEPTPDPQPEANPDIAPEMLAEAETDEPEAAMPNVPTRASVAKQATMANVLNMSKLSLIGIYGTPSNRHAMVRQANGRYVKVSIGDRIDGGRVAAITDSELRYQKGGRMLVLEMPQG